MHVRYGTIDDLQPIAELQMELALETESGLKLDETKLKTGVKKCLGTRSSNDNNVRDLNPFYIVAIVEEKVVGVIGISPEWSDWWGTEYWWVISIFVKPFHRRKRVATELFNFVLELSKRKNIQTVNLRVEKLNSNAIKFYKKVGFIMDDSHHIMSCGKKPDGSVLVQEKDNNMEEHRKKRKQERKKRKMEKFEKKRERGVFHSQKNGSTMNIIIKDHVMSWDEYVKENLNAKESNVMACPSILLIDVMYEGNIGAILRNCFLCGFTRILLFSSKTNSSIYTNNFLKGVIRKSTCLKYNWNAKLVIGLPPSIELVSNVFHGCDYQMVALWGLDEEKRREVEEGKKCKIVKQENLWSVDFNVNKKVVIIGGNEANGIPGNFANHFDTLAFVPSVDSETGAYNISHALHLASYEAFRSWNLSI